MTDPAAQPDEQPDERRDEQHDAERDEQRIGQRASELLPEEAAVGSEVPLEQAEAILAESDERTDDPEGTQREYHQTFDDKRAGGS